MKPSLWQKIGLIFFLSIFISVNFGSPFLSKPKEAKAFFGGGFGGGLVHVVQDTAPSTLANLAANLKELTWDTVIEPIKRAIIMQLKITLINMLTARVLDFVGASPENAKFVLDTAEYIWGSQIYGIDIAGLGSTTTQLIWQAVYDYYCGSPSAEFSINLYLSRKREKDFCEILRRQLKIGKIDYRSYDGWDDFSRILLNWDVATWEGQTASADLKAQETEAKIEQEKSLEYLAHKGLRDVKKNLDRCLLWSADHRECMEKCKSEKKSYEECLKECKNKGRCLKYQSTVTIPGAVVEQAMASVINAPFETIANADSGASQIIGALMQLIANSAIDKLISSVESDNLGLLDKNIGRHKERVSVKFDEYKDEYGEVKEMSQEAMEWLGYKEQSKSLIEDTIIPNLEKLKKCLSDKGLPLVVDGISIDSLISQYQSRLSQIEKQIQEVKKHPENYNPSTYGSPDDAKNEKNNLQDKYGRYSEELGKCQATTPTPTPTPTP